MKVNKNISEAEPRAKRPDSRVRGGIFNDAVRSYLWFLALFAFVLLMLFHDALDPNKVQFSNDAPLGVYMADWLALPGGMKALWFDLNFLGSNQGVCSGIISNSLRMILGSLWYAKIYPPLTLLFLGSCVWLLFRCLKFSPWVCALGGLAAALNSAFFSATCWGVGTQEIAIGSIYLAIAAVVSSDHGHRWVKFVLAGFGVGMAIMEGLDLGAIFSLVVAAFALFHALTGGLSARNLIHGIVRTGVIAVCAAVLSALALAALVGSQIKGISGTSQDAQTKAARWNFATQWSLPKRETLALLVPGLFGYRMDTPEGGHYWGAVGRDASWNSYLAHHKTGRIAGGEVLRIASPTTPTVNFRVPIAGDGSVTVDQIGTVKAKGMTAQELTHALVQQSGGKLPADTVADVTPEGTLRYTGGGNYVGVFVAIVALWTVLQLRRGSTVFTAFERKLVWFWAGVLLISLLLAYGRYAPFYQFVYALPYFSTIRNPVKFLHVFSFAIVILFGFGLHGLARAYLEPALASAAGGRFKLWWTRAAAFDRRWVAGCFVAVVLSLTAWLVYTSSLNRVEDHLVELMKLEAGGPVREDMVHELAHAQAAFSAREVAWSVLVLTASVAVLTLIISGTLAGRRSGVAVALLGIVLVGDLARADRPWILYWNYKEKYASNPIIDFLREKPYEHRVAKLPFNSPVPKLTQLYDYQWIQQLFPYYNIQSLDVVQRPRTPEDIEAFEMALAGQGSPQIGYVRRWELTDTRYLLAAAGFVEPLNQQLDPVQRRFRAVTRFDIVPKASAGLPPNLSRDQVKQAIEMLPLEQLTATPAADGDCALIEFTGALPRAKLYTQWQVSTNDEATLKELSSPSFNPHETVLVSAPIGAATTNAPAGDSTVEFTGYRPKEIRLHANAAAPSVLLLNDRYDRDWRVRVDGKPAELLRCNFIMRGVKLEPGAHDVTFVFRPDDKPFYVSMAAIAVGIALLGVLVVSGVRKRAE